MVQDGRLVATDPDFDATDLRTCNPFAWRPPCATARATAAGGSCIMRITDLEAFTVAVPSPRHLQRVRGELPGRVRTFIRVHTDVGLTGVGEAGVSATHHVAHGAQVQRFRHEIGPRIEGRGSVRTTGRSCCAWACSP
ncbi:MAG: hypothetical protein H6644_06160 [Caldilineaceae bacterium]|nr:hypothetical protein [Caldilineaceae bacterium]